MQAYTPYWLEAQEEELGALWGQHPIYKDHLTELAAQGMLTAFYDNSIDQVETRRTLLYHYLKGPFGTASDDALTLFRRTLPVGTFLPKVVNNLCIAYNQAPARTWKSGDTANDRATQQLRQVYEQFGANGRLQIAYRYMKLCSGVALRPYVGGQKSGKARMQIEILTPDLFRYKTSSLLPDVLTELVRPLVEYRENKVRTVFEVWTDTEIRYTDLTGSTTKYLNDDGEEVEAIDNPYGRIPYMVARLVEPNTMQTFGSGLFDVVEANLAANLYQWLADNSIAYESFGVWVATNMGLQNESKLRLGFGKLVAKDDVGNSADMAEPKLENISNNGQYGDMRSHRTGHIEDVLRGLGLPDSVITSQGGAPPSGIARMLERAELIEQRNADLPLLKLMEAEFSDLVTTVYNIDVAKTTNTQPIPTGLTLDVQFQEEGLILEPSVRLDMNIKALLAGVMLPSRFVREEAGKEVSSEPEAVQYILDNATLIEPIRSVLNGGSPTAATTTTGTQQMPTEAMQSAMIASPEDVAEETEDIET